MGEHIASQIRHPELTSDNTLHVVGVISNTERYHSRYRLAREWIERTKNTPNVKLHVVETAFGDRQHELEDPEVDFLRLRTRTHAWIKENMINLGVRYLVPRDAKFICWEDCDVEHRDPNWARETIHQLQHTPILQPWQTCSDLGPNGSVFQTHSSFGFVDQAGLKRHPQQGIPGTESYVYAHSGFSWACTRAFWEEVGGLLDIAILGSADHHMAWAVVGDVEKTVNVKMGPSYHAACREWQVKARRASGGEVGFVPGRLEHHFHGPKKRRYYRERWQILVDHKFDPLTDLRRDEQGVIYIHGKPELEKAIRQYNRSRLEDSIEET